MAVLRVRNGPSAGTIYPVPDSSRPVLIGRDTSAAIVVPDERASRRHASIAREHGAWILRDLGARNVTRLDGQPVASCEIATGQEIRIGSTFLAFDAEAHAPPPLQDVLGSRIESVVGEEAGVVTCRAFQTALDRRVRVDLILPTYELGDGGIAWLSKAIVAARGAGHPALEPLVHASLDSDIHWIVLRDRESEPLDSLWLDVLSRPLADRIELLRSLVEAVLARGSHESLRFLIAPRRFSVVRQEDGTYAPCLPAIDLPALAAEASGDWIHLPWYVPYAAPERLHRESGDLAHPIGLPALYYELAGFGYHLLTASPPFGGASHREILARREKTNPKRADELGAGIPPEIGRALDAYLARAPNDRPSSASELIAALSPAADSRPAQRSRPEPARIRIGGTALPPKDAPAAGRETAAPGKRGAIPSPKREPNVALAGGALQRATRFLGRPIALPIWMVLWMLVFFAARAATLYWLEPD